MRRRGDRALIEMTRKFDGVKLSPARLRVAPAELDAARDALPRGDRRALELAARRIAEFHRHTLEKSFSYRDGFGMRLGQMVRPLDRVGIYVPGGLGAYPSSVLMNAIPARVAGVREIVMVSPATKDGDRPAVLAAAAIAGVDEVYRIGGAQAIAALAYGTASIRPVDKIVGPGNAWVQAAKRMVYGVADIDKMAGPSEVLVIADAQAHPEWVAADLIAQAEHGSGDESAVLITPSRPLALAVIAAIDRALTDLPRAAAVAKVLAKRERGRGVVKNLEEAFALANRIAPEHLELDIANPTRWLKHVTAAGAVFVGAMSPGAARRLPCRPQSCPAHRRFGTLRLAAGCLRLPQTNQYNRGLSRCAQGAGTGGRAPGPDGGLRGSRASDGIATGAGRLNWYSRKIACAKRARPKREEFSGPKNVR